jgi:hypothetical protein
MRDGPSLALLRVQGGTRSLWLDDSVTMVVVRHRALLSAG